MRRTQIFKDSWAHVKRFYNSETLQGFKRQYGQHTESDVPKLHAEYWTMVGAELQDKKHQVMFRVV